MAGASRWRHKTITTSDCALEALVARSRDVASELDRGGDNSQANASSSAWEDVTSRHRASPPLQSIVPSHLCCAHSCLRSCASRIFFHILPPLVCVIFSLFRAPRTHHSARTYAAHARAHA